MKSPFTQLIIAFLICALALTAYGFWYETISAKSTSVAKLESQIETKTAAVNRLASTRAALAEVTGDEAIVQSYFVPETGVVTFIDDLEARGQAEGATVSVLSVSTGTTGTQSMLTFSLSIKGTFDAVMRTVGAIEYAPYAISISTLSVGNDAKNSWHADLTMVVGSLPADATATSTP